MSPVARVLVIFLALFSGSLVRAALEAFRMPWNDAAASSTNLQSWQPTAAGAQGWVNVSPDGHYQLNGRRIRFLGVNVSGAQAFPPHDRAEAHAARLAKFGFNGVRFHHMEAPWDKTNVLVDYSAGNSRSLSADRLDRLHYFVAQLAARGIYTNINLLVSREFQPSDGLGAEISQLGWKEQHVLGFFMDEAVNLHREYATQVLTAPNPYRGGRSLAQDSAVAFVEIMNENGLLQKWYDNTLDSLPAPYASALQARWNAWLRTRYGSTAEMLAAWGAVNEPLGANRLVNGTFASGTTSWNLEQHASAVATMTAGTEFNGSPSLRIDATAAGTANWHVQLTQGGLSLEAGRTYTVSFYAKAAAATPLNATLTRTGPSDYSAVSRSLSATLGTSWQEYTLTFQAATNESSVRLAFNGFGDRVATVYLADVRVQQGGQIGGLPEGAALESSTVPTVPRNAAAGSATANQTRDWITYVLAAEKSYWETMKAHIKDVIGYRGIVFATIISNSAPNTQIAMDAIDSHAYWQHPQFPAGRDFDPVEWTVTNTSMVNTPSSNTLTGIARQRVAGMPHNVTEYQHASPNTYASEGPLLAAAYGALQDWDSIWMFDYITGTSEYVTGFFDHGGHPGKMANNLIAAALFRRGDVSRASTVHTMAFTPTTEIEAARTRGGAWSIADGSHLNVPATLAYQNRLELDIGDDATGLTEAPAAPSGSVITADTNQLRWDNSVANKGVVTIDTPTTAGVVGFTASRTFDLSGVIIAPGATRQDWCTIALTLLEGTSFSSDGSARGIVVATGEHENTGQQWKDSSRTSVGANWGSAPTLVEVVPATITLPVSATRVTAWTLDGQGNRLAALAVRDSGGKAQFDLGQSGATLWYEFVIAAGGPTAPTASASALTHAVEAGAPVTLGVSATGNPSPTIQWTRNGTALSNAASSEITLTNVQPEHTGIYQASLSNATGTANAEPVIVGVSTTSKVIGAGQELQPANIVHPNGNVFDQVLVTGTAEAITSDFAANQITRTSFVDLDNDIVQIEFSGPGTLSLVLDAASGPATPVNYQQNVAYMKGVAGIVITGADERTNVSVFTVGRATAFDPTGGFNFMQPISASNNPANNGSSLFTNHANTTYDGVADLSFIAIASTNGRFGGIRAANAHFFATRGITGIYAPGITFAGPVFVGNVSAFDAATPMLRLGYGGDVRITGGSLLQDNNQPVQVSGIRQLRFTAGSDSHGNVFSAKTNQAVLHEDGRDVTGEIVVNP